MYELVLATKNPKKVQEIKAILEGLNLKIPIFSLIDFPEAPKLKEMGSTYLENSVNKAKTVAKFTQKVALADDSGLEVDALGGQPGIYSSRFAGEGANDRQLIEKVLKLMKDIPWGQRQARFRCMIAVSTPEGEIKTAEGICEGLIAHEPHGKYGFGYDPIFWVPEYQRTMAELPPWVKNQISHRARALQAAKSILKQLLR